MDADQVAKVWEFLNSETDRRLGPRTAGYDEFRGTVSLVDASPFLGPGTHLVPHYRIGGTAFTAYNLPGFFEANKMALHPTDVLLTSFPKTGTTWVSEIIYLILNDADVEKARSIPIDHRIPYLEWPHCTLKTLSETPPPRFIKTHRPFHLLCDAVGDKKYKIVYITRNPKDTVVSYYHFCKQYRLVQFVGEFKDFFNLFLNDAISFTPFETHALGYWEHRNDANVHFMKYEDLLKNTKEEVKKLAQFLEKDLTDEQFQRIMMATSFQQMKGNKTSNHGHWDQSYSNDKKGFTFMRKGKIGDWKNHFDEEMNRRFDEWIEKKFTNTDLQYDYE